MEPFEDVELSEVPELPEPLEEPEVEEDPFESEGVLDFEAPASAVELDESADEPFVLASLRLSVR